MYDLESELKIVAFQVDAMLDDVLCNKRSKEERESPLVDAMRYTAIGAGKRIRAFLVLQSAKLFFADQNVALYAASAIEMVHAYSLIHDDLPCMDDSDTRRGKPSCHKKYGEAMALLAGNGLLTAAFELLAKPDLLLDDTKKLELIRVLGNVAGMTGMLEGQVLDMMAESNNIKLEDIIKLQNLKTGKLFVASCDFGSIIGSATPDLRSALIEYATKIGLAFQIKDDLLDVEGDHKQLGKAVNQDSESCKSTFLSYMKKEEANQYINLLIYDAIGHLEVFGEDAMPLQILAKFIATRQR